MFNLFKLATLSFAAATVTFAGIPSATATGMTPTSDLTPMPELMSGDASEGQLVASRRIRVRRRRRRILRRVRRNRRRVCFRRYYRRNGRLRSRRVCRYRRIRRRALLKPRFY
ncbi:hypothetical protein IQ266_20625 [filamentous cyanobacterium LEGE 11480]|uniref:Sperm protamine P1 n=1 Tax=Romeriopsis navalis LEGE 11480 TaxID=2777977 RepID=A0A928Z623_9CYAN|nr:hypothetical protein [Romeriopsis navalis]MBE9032148.1 hypothetical protein [Romeriopsis navalis LEGE 11480]